MEDVITMERFFKSLPFQSLPYSSNHAFQISHGGTYFAAATAELNTPRTLTLNTSLKSLVVSSREGFTTETPAFCDPIDRFKK
jgi:hypothetical protein